MENQRFRTTEELTPLQVHTENIPVDKLQYLIRISKLSISSLKILAEKSEKAGIEQRLERFKNFI